MSDASSTSSFTPAGGIGSTLNFIMVFTAVLSIPTVGIIMMTLLLAKPLELWSLTLAAANQGDSQQLVIQGQLLENVTRAFRFAFLFVSGSVGLTIVAFFLFIVWVARAQTNYDAIGSRGQKYSAGVTLILWFVPVLNLILPYRALRELWDASDPGGLVDRRLGKDMTDIPLLVWWICYIGSVGWIYCFVCAQLIAIYVFGFTPDKSIAFMASPRALTAAITWLTISATMMVFFNLTGAGLAARLNKMQTDRHRLYLQRQQKR